MTNNAKTECTCDENNNFQYKDDTIECECKSGYKLEGTTCVVDPEPTPDDSDSSASYIAIVAILCVILTVLCATITAVFVAMRKAVAQESLTTPEVI